LRAARRYRAEFHTEYEPGTIEAIAYGDGAERGRTILQSASGDVLLDVRAERSAVASDRGPYTSAVCKVTVDVDGPGVLQGLRQRGFED
jgi:beta-galactosidase